MPFLSEIVEEEEYDLGDSGADAGEPAGLDDFGEGEYLGERAVVGDEVVDPGDFEYHGGGGDDVDPEVEGAVVLLPADDVDHHLEGEDDDGDYVRVAQHVRRLLVEEGLLDVDDEDAVQGQRRHQEVVDLVVHQRLDLLRWGWGTSESLKICWDYSPIEAEEVS